MSTRTIAARFVDASRGHAGSGWLPVIPYLTFPLWMAAQSMHALVWVPAILGLLLFALPRAWRHTQRGECTIDLRPGRIRVGRSIVLRARDIEGASTARTGHGIAITVKPKRLQPITVLVASERDAHDVLAALGIGHTGVGRLDWILVPSSYAQVVFVLDALLAAAFFFTLVIAAQGETANAALPLFVGLAVAIGSAIARVQWRNMGRRIVFDPWGVWLEHQQVPWTKIRAANDHPDGIQLGLDTGSAILKMPRGSIGPAEKEIVLDQILAGIGRAHGLGTAKAEPHTRVDILARSGDEPRRWLTRIDAIAASIGNAGYRAASIELADLWLTLEDPEAAPNLRAASARVLARIAPAERARIDAAITATRDADDAKRMRVVMEPDAEEAAERLERLEV